MNKTININLGGLFFYIDEDAYTDLQTYLERIKNSLRDDTAGKSEIIADIEARISELLNDRMKSARQVVNQEDIKHIIEIMGEPEIYEEEEAFTDTNKNKTESKEETKESAFESNSSTQTESTNTNKKKRKLYRDSEEKIIGGVCGGLSKYFTIDIVWIRLLWALLIIFGGTGFPLYIILWAIIPEAKTTAQKLEMQGEDVNISNIEKNIKKEWEKASQNIKETFESASDDLKKGMEGFNESIKKKDFEGFRSKASEKVEDIVDRGTSIFSKIGRILKKVIGGFFTFIGATSIAGIVIGLFTVGSIGISAPHWIQLHANSNGMIPSWLFAIMVALLSGIPFLLLTILGLKLWSGNVKKVKRVTRKNLIIIWFLSLFGVIYWGVEKEADSAYNYEISKRESLELKKNDTLTVAIKSLDKEIFGDDFHKQTMNSMGEEMFVNETINVYFKEIKNTKSPYVKIIKYSDGYSKEEAEESVESMAYNYVVTNNRLEIDNFFLSKESKDTNKRIKWYIYIPTGVHVAFSPNQKGVSYSNVEDNDLIDGNDIVYYYEWEDGELIVKEEENSKETEEKEEEEEEVKETIEVVQKVDSIKTASKTTLELEMENRRLKKELEKLKSNSNSNNTPKNEK